MTVFEPESIRQQCAMTIDDLEERENFILTWKRNAERRAKNWGDHRENQSKHPVLLRWISEITEFLTATANAIHSSQGADLSVALDPRWPSPGPLFEPPTYLEQFLREVNPEIEPDTAYLLPCYAVHWLQHSQLRRCPKCHGKKLESNGWNQSGPREVHGLFREEMAIGIQFRCLDCAKKGQTGQEGSEGRYCWTTTSADFWDNFEHWELPVGLPHFFSRSAVTSELFDFIAEMRLKSTSAGLAENIKQLHLLEYHKQHYQYLQSYRARSQQMTIVKQKKPLVPFSKPLTKKVGKQTGGYNNRSISADLITTIFLKFCNKTRIAESEEHMRALSAVAISLDTTFRCAYKATLVDKNKARVKSHLGGFVSVINEKSQPISWRLCHSQSQTETQEMLSGLSARLTSLELPSPEILTSDNCCQIRNTALRVFPHIQVVQDVWHFLMRYLVCVQDGTKNPHRGEVANDIVDALLKTRAANGVPASYHSQPEQEKRLVAAYNKWKDHGDVWTAAAEKVHANQLSHIQKGCLSRPRDDIATDGSRIEGSHKGWNSIMRSFASGLEVMNALGHDHVLRHNVRLDMQDDALDKSMFMYHTHGSHHIHLVDACNKLWNHLLERQRKRGPLPATVRPLPELRLVDSGERFGLVKMSAETATQYSLTTIKQEPGDETLDLSLQDVLDPDRILQEIGVDPALLHAPTSAPTAPRDTPSVVATVTEPIAKSVPDAGPKGKGMKRARTEEAQDDDVIELSSEEWGVPKEWFPLSAQPAGAVMFTTAGTSVVSTPGALATAPGAPATTSSGPSGPSRTDVAAPDALAMTLYSAGVAAPGALAVASSVPSNAGVAAPGAPAISSCNTAATAAATGASAGSPNMGIAALAVPTMSLLDESTLSLPGVPSTMFTTVTPMSLPSGASASPTITPSGAGAHENGDPPPRKKVCLTVAGMPAPFKTSDGGVSSSKKPRKQRAPQNNPGTLDAMFQMQTTASTATLGPNLTPTNEPCLPQVQILGLTRSQRLFSVVTQVDPRSLVFGKGGPPQEFYLFMELRAMHQWATFRMTPYDWVCAASTYNTAIRKLNRERGTTYSLKTPRALLDKLAEVEGQVVVRIRDKKYQSRSGRTNFWEHHCKAVYLGTKIQKMTDDAQFKIDKNHVCGRCKRIMYPEGKNHKDNHSRKICSDGVRQTPGKVHLVINGVACDFVEPPPPFPQPDNIFTGGDIFHPARFMEVVSRFYDRIVINHSASGALAMTDYAFASLLYDRTVIVPGLDGRPSKVIFKLFHSFKMAPGEPAVLDEHEGEMYLRMDCLSEPPLEVLQDATAAGSA